MKVIDLLNKIAEGKQPKKIMFDTEEYIWEETLKEYRRYPYDNNLYYSLYSDYDLTKCLNEDVEIIEYSNNNGLNAFEEPFNNDIRFRLIIDKLNELEGKING